MIRIVRDYAGPLLHPGGCVACIGAFDGLHLGHQALIGAVREAALDRGLPLAMVSFEPLPREYFGGPAAPPRLLPLRDKLRELRRLGIDTLWLLRFDAALASVDPEAFVRDGLVARLGVRELHVGCDFRFGHRRAGDLALLERLSGPLGYRLKPLDEVSIHGQRVSSTRVREALGRGDLDTAAMLLGRRYALSGHVFGGQRLGRRLGFPTANLRLGRCRALREGVYAVEVVLADGRHRPGVASLGRRPTVGAGEPWLEVHLFDFDEDLYGQRLRVVFHRWLRAEQSFAGLDALVEQMHRDAEAARAIMAATPLREAAR